MRHPLAASARPIAGHPAGTVAVQVTEQGDLGSVVNLLIKQNPDDLPSDQRLPEVTGSSLCQVLIVGAVQPCLDRLSAGPPVGQDLTTVPWTGRSGKLRTPGPNACSM